MWKLHRKLQKEMVSTEAQNAKGWMQMKTRGGKLLGQWLTARQAGHQQ
jgi:hypothetical protein